MGGGYWTTGGKRTRTLVPLQGGPAAAELVEQIGDQFSCHVVLNVGIVLAEIEQAHQRISSSDVADTIGVVRCQTNG